MGRWLGTVMVAVAVCLIGRADTLAAEETTGSAEWKLPPVRVLDDVGTPIPGAEVLLVNRGNPMVCFSAKKTDGDGEIVFTKGEYMWPGPKQVPPGNYRVMVLAQGRAPAYSQWEMPTSAPLTVRAADKGVPVVVTLTGPGGAPVPADLVPLFFPKEYGFALWPNRITDSAIDPAWPKRIGDGKFEISLVEGSTEPLQMLVHHPAYLRAFLKTIETTEALKLRSVQVELPNAAHATMKLEIPDKLAGPAAHKEFSFTASTLVNLGGEQDMYLSAADNVKKPGGDLSADFKYLAPGEYWMSVGEHLETTGPERHKMAAFNKGEGVEVKTGETTTVLVQYTEFDRSKLRGNFSANVSVKKLDGVPAAGMEFELRNLDREFGWYVVTTGTLNNAGTTTISGLAGGGKDAPTFRLYEGGEWGNLIGRFKFDSAETAHSFEFTLAPKADDIAPDVAFIDVYTSEPVKLSAFRGKVIVLDFWATWCGPCQAPMEHNQKMLTENAAKWQDKVVIIGASIDDDTETVRRHVKQKGWDKVRHLWCGTPSRDTGPARVYGVDGVPTIVLIGPDGKIVDQTGDLEVQIGKLLK